MKNIHLIETDKPSRLIHNDANQLCYQSNKSFKNDRKWMSRKKFNICITNHEEPKHNDYYYDFEYQKVKKCETGYYNKGSKKIVLAADPDLIDDDVQSIDDEFLEWFVKNPSCEEVEVESWTIDKEWDKVHTQFNPIYPQKTKYKTIIPQDKPKSFSDFSDKFFGSNSKEEPKQENCCTPIGQIKRYVDCKGCDRRPKQELQEQPQDPCFNCGKTIREQMKGCNQITCYRQFLPKQDYTGVHLSHCYQGEYGEGCKYGEDDCPAKPLGNLKPELIKEVMKRPNQYSKPLKGARTESYHPSDCTNNQYADDLNTYIDYLELQLKQDWEGSY